MAKKFPLVEGYCPSCKERKKGHMEDFGIGSYEYWGAKGTHHDYQAVCDDCEDFLDDWEEIEQDYPDRFEEY